MSPLVYLNPLSGQALTMMKRFLYLASPFLLLFSIVQAQSLNIHYEVRNGGTSSVDTVIVYMRSNSANPVSIRAVNFSMAYQFNCSSYDTYSSIFPGKWSSFFQRHLIRRNLNLSYGTNTYDSRWLYAIGDANLTSSSILVIPDNTQPLLEVMRVTFFGTCNATIYMEDQAENPVNQIADANLNNLSYNIFRLSGPPSLPVEYINWEARALPNGTAALSWKTSSELNNDYFMVEKSLGPDFEVKEDILKVEGEGTPVDEASYTVIDDGIMQDVVYYRLRQVDFDGTFEYSDVRKVNFQQVSPELDMTVFPNPTRDNVKIQVSFAEEMRLSLMLFDSKGRLVRTMVGSANQTINFPLGNLPPGTYYLHAKGRHAGKAINQKKAIVLAR